MQVYAVDASEEAAAWATVNVQRYSLEARLQVSTSCGAVLSDVCLNMISDQVEEFLIYLRNLTNAPSGALHRFH